MNRQSLARLLVIIPTTLLAATLAPSRALAQAKTLIQAESFEKEKLFEKGESPAPVPEREPAPTPERERVAQKIDEFGLVGGCDHGARLDNFAIELQSVPDAVGYIIVYGVEGETSGTAGYRLRFVKEYLVNVRDIADERIKTIYGGPYRKKDESFSELWVVPPGAEPPEPVKFKNDAATFKGRFYESEAWDGDIVEYDPGTGPPVGDTTVAGFAEVLRLQPSLAAYVVAYDGKEAAFGAWRRVGERDAEHLHERYGIEASRVKVLFGGYKKETTVELWALPKDATPPLKGDKKERRPEKAQSFGDFSQYDLKYEENERRVFKELAAILKADDMLSVCIVVWPNVPSNGNVNPEVTPDPKEPPDVDLARLAETWKARLSKEYGIGEHRVTLMVMPSSDEGRSDELETWVVPPGAPLPDPSAVEGEGDGQEEENP